MDKCGTCGGVAPVCDHGYICPDCPDSWGSKMERRAEGLEDKLRELEAENARLRESGKAFVRYCLDRAFQVVTQNNENRGPYQDRRWWREVRHAAIEAARGKKAAYSTIQNCIADAAREGE